MINSANICIFEGRMVRDPQYSNVQMGQDNVEKALFTIAVDRALSAAQRQKAKNGDQSVKTADFIPCSLLGAQVATLRQYFPVGKSIRVIGHYTEYQTTDNQTGQKKYGHMFEIDNIGFAVQDSKNLQQNGGQQAPQQGYQPAPQQGYQQSAQVNQPMYQPQQNYQQPAQPQYQQPAQQGFAMFDENESPF
jgi:single-stranded DNA-binding protein